MEIQLLVSRTLTGNDANRDNKRKAGIKSNLGIAGGALGNRALCLFRASIQPILVESFFSVRLIKGIGGLNFPFLLQIG